MSSNIYKHVPDKVISCTDILTRKECKQLISDIESNQTPKSFYVKNDINLANQLWMIVNKALPCNLHKCNPIPYMNSQSCGDEYTPIGVNEHIRFYKYEVGKYILNHDNCRMFRYRFDKDTNKYYQQMTFFTLLVYLNDEFEDGETLYCTNLSNGKSTKYKYTDYDLELKPMTGVALISDHDTPYVNKYPKTGCKYILRTEIIYERIV